MFLLTKWIKSKRRWYAYCSIFLWGFVLWYLTTALTFLYCSFSVTDINRIVLGDLQSSHRDSTLWFHHLRQLVYSCFQYFLKVSDQCNTMIKILESKTDQWFGIDVIWKFCLAGLNSNQACYTEICQCCRSVIHQF